MNIKKQIQLYIGILLISLSGAVAQSFDEARMERDLKIAENILSTLSSGDNRIRMYDNVESNYIPDYGVIFSLPRTAMLFGYSGKGGVVYTTGAYTVVSGDQAEATAVQEAKEAEEDEIDLEKVKKEAEEKMKNVMIDFLADYADLIGQLKPTDRVVVQSKSRNERIFIGGRNATNNNSGLSAQALKSDISAYKQGKMSKDAFVGKIEFISGDETEVPKDVELFSTIFARLYEPDLSSTYYTSSRAIGYTQLANFGITFNMKVYSSSSDNGLHTIRTTGESGLTQEERNDKVNAMYPDFVKSFKENLLDYGRTIKSIKADEMIIFKVELTECRGCDMPQRIEVSVKGKTLHDYDSGSISRDKAIGMVSVVEKRK